MHIKAISVSGFRSYRDKVTIDDLSRQFNVVVGQNGSGKSNFFAAIQFVLSDEKASISVAERQNLLHEGTGNRSSTAIVELVFDNSDRRLAAIDANTFTISRHVSVKKDQYYIDNRMVSRSDINNMMESAGFSRSNPYYIVKQGKISELATGTDLYRLKLLREIAGTRIYDEKKAESLTILNDCSTKLMRSRELLELLNARLAKLESEKEDLKEYQRHDKKRRVLEYSIANSEVRESKKEFDALMAQRQQLQSALNDAEAVKFDHSKNIGSLENDIRRLEMREKISADELTSSRAEEAKLQSEQSMMKLQTQDLKEQVELERGVRAQAENDLANLNTVIEKKERELQELRPKYQELVELQASIVGDINISERKRTELFAKTGSKQDYATAADRDRALNAKIMQLNHHIQDQNDSIARFVASYEEEKQTMLNTQERINEIEASIRENILRMDEMTTQDDKFRGNVDEAARNLHERELSRKNLADRLAELESQREHVEANYFQMLPKAVSEGTRAVNTIINDLKANNANGRYDEYINGYHGVVIKLMSSEPQYYKALEVTAGSTLTHHVVDNERIAMFLLAQINERNLRGQATFFALNRVFSSELRPLKDRNGKHLLSFVRYSERYDPVFRNIFGSTILVKDIQTGRVISRLEKFNCITFDGDEISHSGPMTGGYVDARKSRLETVSNLASLEPEINNLKEQLRQTTTACIECENKLASARLSLTSNEQERNTLQRLHEEISSEKRELCELYNRLHMNVEKADAEIVILRRKLRESIAHRDQLQSQLGAPLSSQLSGDESQELEQLDEFLKEKRAEATNIMDRTLEIQNQKVRLENELNSCLLRQREDLKIKVNAINFEVKSHEYQTRLMDAGKIQERIREINRQNEQYHEELMTIRNNISQKRAELEKAIDERNEADQTISNNAADVELIRRRMSDCQKRREEATKKMKELGNLPIDMINKYANMRKKDLETEWMESIDYMKRFTNVNKKALDQYIRSTAERDSLQTQIDEMNENSNSINRLIEASENRKYDALYLTFRQVAKNFREIFGKLVPHGRGDLIMKTPPASEVDRSNNGDANAAKSNVLAQFIGVGIRVNFQDTNETEARELNHLSGGQKTLVALALIFAIQKCDPAPFYLFDEIDAALDPEKRHAVARLIDEFSTNAQFIATTFRPEMLQYADRCYGVRFRNKISYVSPVDAIDAREFLAVDDVLEDTEMEEAEQP
uniref:Structural maintenance of chromosomes protein n=1 Tax=Panagrellus redivivus TaxID=6233 RepID=A0A7E4ZS38_PANRE